MANSIISEIQRTIGMNDSASIWMGLDVHKHSYHIALVSGESRPVTSSAPADPSSVVKTLHSNGIHLQGACFEAGPTGFKLASVLKSEGKKPPAVFADGMAESSEFPRQPAG
jgi:transposase